MDHASSVDEALDALAVQNYDVIILDIGLPDGLGTDVLESLRNRGKATPVLMLTARSDIEDRVAALDKGADDYLIKPFDLRELHARVRAMIRRQDVDRSGTIEFGDIIFDPAGLTVEVKGSPVSLARRQFSVLEILLANRERVVPKDTQLERLYSFNDEAVSANAVELKKLRGLGYQLVDGD